MNAFIISISWFLASSGRVPVVSIFLRVAFAFFLRYFKSLRFLSTTSLTSSLRKMSFADAYDVIAANVKNEEAKRIYTDWIERLKKETFIKVY